VWLERIGQMVEAAERGGKRYRRLGLVAVSLHRTEGHSWSGGGIRVVVHAEDLEAVLRDALAARRIQGIDDLRVLLQELATGFLQQARQADHPVVGLGDKRAVRGEPFA